MGKRKANILIFSPSSRKVWVQPLTRILNPSYWLLSYLAARLADEHNVYTIETSFDAVGGVKKYKGEHVDVVVSIGASYNPSNTKCEINKGYSLHDRAFEIGHVTKSVFAKFKPLHVNINADVRRWFDKLTEVFCPEPDVIITEQEMMWQPCGYLINYKVNKGCKGIPKATQFFFSGGAKTRYEEFRKLTQGIAIPKVIHGGGWEGKLDASFQLDGFTQWWDSVQVFARSKYGLTLHEPIGYAEGWLTAKYFEHLGCQTVGFVSHLYDRDERVVPHNSTLRVSEAGEIQDKINTIGYDKLLAEQNKTIRPEWLDLENFYVKPFLQRMQQVIS